MSQPISITSGSIFANNPITVSYTPLNLSDKNPSIHRVIFDVTAGTTLFSFSQPVVSEGESVSIDISSALKAVFDIHEWQPTATTPPSAGWNVDAYDEYMIAGELTRSEKTHLEGYTCYPGGFSEIERISGNTSLPRFFSRKPTSLPEIVSVNDEVCVPATARVPSSTIHTVSTEGLQTFANVYAITTSRSTERVQIRFINSFGCLESISVPRAYSKENAYQTEKFVISKQQTFSSPSHAVVKKLHDSEKWAFTSGPVDKEWLSWFLHELVMAEHAWIKIAGQWIRVHITPEESIKFSDETKAETFEVAFSVEMDIEGPIPSF